MLDFGAPTLIELKSTEDTAKLCSELGLKFIELNMSFPQYQPESMDVVALEKIKKDYGIYYTIHIDEALDPCSVNKGIAEVYTQTMLKTVEIAKKLQIPSLNMHLLRGIYVTLPHGRTYVYAENEQLYLDSFRVFRDKVTEAIGNADIRVSIENTDGFDLPFLRHALDLLLESQAFSMTFDIGHDHAVNNIDKPEILKRSDRLHHMHMHDAAGTKVHRALGDGEMNIQEYLNLAKEHNCRVVLETKTVEALKKSVAWLKDHGEM